MLIERKVLKNRMSSTRTVGKGNGLIKFQISSRIKKEKYSNNSRSRHLLNDKSCSHILSVIKTPRGKSEFEI